jgi:hypothetical protein
MSPLVTSRLKPTVNSSTQAMGLGLMPQINMLLLLLLH